jgi:hypothetical protein
MFKRLMVPMMALALFAGACSDDDGGNVCEQYFNKIKDCASKLDCASVTDATKKMICETMKSTYGSITYSQSITACKQNPPANGCECDGANKTSAEAAMKQELDPETCAPKTTAGDTGPTGDSTVDGGVTPDTGAGDMAMGE